MYNTIFLYIRVSLADEDKDESNRITHQKMLLHQFLDENAELKKFPRKEFVDDGFTGTKADRPAFQQMISDIRCRKGIIVITKDFSRLHRDYAEMGNYLECIFPFLGVRYISVNDGYDSNDYKDRTGGMDVVLRNIVYAAYSKDIAMKTSSSRRQMRKEGKHAAGCFIYGYQKHREMKHKLAIDPEAAAVVRQIFDMALAGKNACAIARQLNENGVLTRSAYFAEKYPDQKKHCSALRDTKWSNYAVIRILQQYQYTGALVGNKVQKAGVLYKETTYHSQEEWTIVEDMHEPIVTKEEFERVKEILHFGKKRKPNMQHQYPLKGRLYCGHCRKRLGRAGQGETWLYRCSHAYSGVNPLCSTRKYIGEKELEHCVLGAIRRILMELKSQQEEQQNIEHKSVAKQLQLEIDALDNKRKQHEQEKRHLYEKYVSGALDRETYKRQKDVLLHAIAEQNSKLELRLKKIELLNEAEYGENTYEEITGAYLNNRNLTAEMVQAFIEAVYVYPDKRIEIEWNFGSIMTL